MCKKKYYTSGNIADMFGVSITTVLNWHKKGLLVPDKILQSGHRRYSEKLVKEFIEKYNIIRH